MTQGTKIQNRFRRGDIVRVLHLGKIGHVRIPFYVRGKRGEIVHYCGSYLNPEDLATGVTSNPIKDLYRVKFKNLELWPDDGQSLSFILTIEIYDHWLEPLVCRSDIEK